MTGEAYTVRQAKKEIGGSRDPITGLEASIKKWEQIVAGDTESYKSWEACGLCMVDDNDGQDCGWCEETFPAISRLCRRGRSIDKTDPRRLLAYLRRSLTRLRKKESLERGDHGS